MIIIILSLIIFITILVGIIFLQKLLSKKNLILGLLLPIVSLCYSIIIDKELISAIISYFSGPKTIE